MAPSLLNAGVRWFQIRLVTAFFAGLALAVVSIPSESDQKSGFSPVKFLSATLCALQREDFGIAEADSLFTAADPIQTRNDSPLFARRNSLLLATQLLPQIDASLHPDQFARPPPASPLTHRKIFQNRQQQNANETQTTDS